MLLYIIILFLLTFSCTMSTSYDISKPECPNQCGNVTVPYPFGIGKDSSCSLDDSFYVTCNTTFQPAQLFLGNGDLRIHDIADTDFRIFTRLSYSCYNKTGGLDVNSGWWFSLKQFTFSEKNKFTVVGCDDYALITGENNKKYSSGCIGLCSKPLEVPDGKCTGEGCCQTSIAKGLSYYSVSLGSYRNHTDVWPFNSCGYAFLAEEGSFQFRGINDSSNFTKFLERSESTLVAAIDWVILSGKRGSACGDNSNSYDVDGGGYRCSCKDGYEGNPYIGCQDINECDHLEKFPCNGTCFNTNGSYKCKCKDGYSGDGKNKDGCQRKSFPVLQFSLGFGFAFLVVMIGSCIIYYTTKKRKLLLKRQKLFEQNGGLLLQDKLKTNSGHASMKIFRVKDLEEATDNYAEKNIIGKGYNGTVYKGILVDKRIVAIKKSQRLDEEQREQFINEMIILTQINHHNVVQLLGCCLETDVPLLAYEFISNDTLYHHIQDKASDTERLSWNSRLRIAHESAGALSYLHTEARMPIIHRDVKSTNILLDDNYTAKIADFGASRFVPLGHSLVPTLVQGTFGYLDPEYFHTGVLTVKSDVYSFGVVLVELLTGEKPISTERSPEEDRTLAMYFEKAKKENRLFEIVDHDVVKEASKEQIIATCDLVYMCLNQVGVSRPSMREVTNELERIIRIAS
ncbi:wall-associated receptor kinase 2-like [Rutidosis leptorrhynchoides]|uniref:wall-associated receptor kinase 2-like n=1 Tax=Rutidosis leptorrhynchoides TaxID=125765 RepID=UPI003A996DF6